VCGRYELSKFQGPEIAELFGVRDVPSLAPRYNVAPTQLVAAVRRLPGSPAPELVMFRWGLVASWAKAVSSRSTTIMARAETAAEKPAFSASVRLRRCVLLASGFFEWGSDRRPWRFHRSDGKPFGMAGLWDRWTDPAGKVVESCAVLTQAANESVAPVHDRMPAIVRAERLASWLDPSQTDAGAALALLRPLDAGELRRQPVSRLVNDPRNDDPRVLEESGSSA